MTKRESTRTRGPPQKAGGFRIASGDLASLADLMGHESVEIAKSFYAVFEQLLACPSTCLRHAQ